MQELLSEVARSLIPVRMEVVWGGITGMAGLIITSIFGEWKSALKALAAFMFIDYLTGVMAAYIKPGAELSSKRGLVGIVKKLALVMFVSLGHWLDIALNQDVFCTLATYSMLGNEGMSIVENLSLCGVPIPKAIQEKLKQLADEKERDDK